MITIQCSKCCGAELLDAPSTTTYEGQYCSQCRNQCSPCDIEDPKCKEFLTKT